MAVTRNSSGQVIKFGAAADALTGKFKIQAIVLEHSAAANAVLTETDDKPIAVIRVAANDLFDELVFPKPIVVNGIKAATLSAGNLYVYLE